MKILIVEDDITTLIKMEGLLSDFGDCDTAENGVDGVLAFEAAIKKGQPYDLVCLDILMPEMDGQEALKRIREIEKNMEIKERDEAKIIMTTALSDPDSITDALYEGEATSYLVKPVTIEKLSEKLHNMGFKALEVN